MKYLFFTINGSSLTVNRIYSDLIASNADKFIALLAGKYPETIPINPEKPLQLMLTKKV